jgi:hypothetical protein
MISQVPSSRCACTAVSTTKPAREMAKQETSSFNPSREFSHYVYLRVTFKFSHYNFMGKKKVILGLELSTFAVSIESTWYTQGHLDTKIIMKRTS